jgi:hypothetical protein
MAKLIGSQLSLIAESEIEHRPIGDWDYDDIGPIKVQNQPIFIRNINYLAPPAPTPPPLDLDNPLPSIYRSDLPKLGTENLHTPNSPLPQLGTENLPVPNSHLPELGTDKISVPNSHNPELGTNNLPVPNSLNTELGTEIWLVPNFDDWHPPLGCLQQKWIKDHQYWYWRYYKINGKKRSRYLGKDYNKAILKAIKIGIPSDAKLPKSPRPQADSQNQFGATSNLIDLAQTAYGTSRNPPPASSSTLAA